jgi:hypothetical protein
MSQRHGMLDDACSRAPKFTSSVAKIAWKYGEPIADPALLYVVHRPDAAKKLARILRWAPD